MREPKPPNKKTNSDNNFRIPISMIYGLDFFTIHACHRCENERAYAPHIIILVCSKYVICIQSNETSILEVCACCYFHMMTCDMYSIH